MSRDIKVECMYKTIMKNIHDKDVVILKKKGLTKQQKAYLIGRLSVINEIQCLSNEQMVKEYR